MGKLIKCITLSPAMENQHYRGKSGEMYSFNLHAPTKVSDEDAEHFLKASGGNSFVQVGTFKDEVKKVAEKAAEVVEKTVETVKNVVAPKEEAPELEDRELILKLALEEGRDCSEKEARLLIQEQQKDLIPHLAKEAGIEVSIPPRENERVALILELQKQRASKKPSKKAPKKKGAAPKVEVKTDAPAPEEKPEEKADTTSESNPTGEDE